MATKKRAPARKMKCASCDKALRRGMGRKALVLSHHGEPPAMGTICPGCVARSLLVCTPPPVTVAPSCPCRKGPAKFCERCHGRLAENVGSLAAANIARVPVTPGPGGPSVEPITIDLPGGLSALLEGHGFTGFLTISRDDGREIDGEEVATLIASLDGAS
jgi:hypothetical protein